MRNLQKILALALALIMSFSLVVTANAAFSDEADITDTYNESVNVLSQLEVFKGYTDGTYQPQKSITRAEVAAIIYRIATGDVADTQVSIYSDWERFSDVHAGEWWAGYINYCANAEYIKGYGNGKFGPDDPVTGYEALAMILRAVGYGKMEGEFQGSDWAVQTAARANTLKVTKNVQNSALLNSAATRELVAELLFRSILVPTVEYNQFSGYTENDTTLGYESFGLEAIQGVVVANEYANLYGEEVLAKDKTNLEVAKDDVRSLDITSELTDIGESRYAYVSGPKVYALEDTGLNEQTFETGAAVDIATASKFNKVSGLTEAEGIEYYVDFGQEGNYSSDYRLEFNVTFKTLASGKAAMTIMEEFEDKYISSGNTLVDIMGKATNGLTGPEIPTITLSHTEISFQMIIRAEEDISQDALDVIHGIFAAADDDDSGNGTDNTYEGIEGNVYAGSRSSQDNATNRYEDLSDEISYRTFYRDYINAETYDKSWETSENGQWVKIVDNNNDGKAEYAFKTQYHLDEAVGTYTKGGETYLEYYHADIVNDYEALYLEDIEVGDIVIYTLIDGLATIKKAETAQATVKTVNYKDTSITTTDGDEYFQSGIHNDTKMDQLIVNMDEKVAYDLYFDEYGYVRAYAPIEGNKYGLLSEMYYGHYQNGRYVTGEDVTVELTTPDKKATEYLVDSGAGNFLLDIDNDAKTQDVWSKTLSNNLHAAVSALTGSSAWYNGIYNADDNADKIVLQPATDHLALSEQGRTAAAVYQNASTNVAKYVMTEDGEVRIASAATYAYNRDGEQLFYADWDSNGSGSKTSADKVTIAEWEANNSGATWHNDLDPVYAVDYVELDRSEGVAKGTPYYYLANPDSYHGDRVNAVDTTEIYIVTGDSITYRLGYKNMPKFEADAIDALYAVVRNTESDQSAVDYWVADVIVIEVDAYDTDYSSISLVYYNPTKSDMSSARTTMARAVDAGINLMASVNKYLNTLNNKYSGEGAPEMVVIPTGEVWKDQYGDYAFYELRDETATDEGTEAKLTAIGLGEYNKHGIYAGVIDREQRLDEGKYIDVILDDANVSVSNNGTPVNYDDSNVEDVSRNTTFWTVGATNARTWRAEELYLNNRYNHIRTEDRVIWVMNGDNVAYIVDLDFAGSRDSNYGSNWKSASWLEDIYEEIITEQRLSAAGLLDSEKDPDAPKGMDAIVAALNAAWKKYDEASTAGELTDEIEKALVKALIDYVANEDDMTRNQIAAAATAYAAASAEVPDILDTSDLLNASPSTYADYKGLWEDVSTLSDDEVALLDKLYYDAAVAADPSYSGTETPFSDAKDDLKDDYDSATEDMALLSDLLDAYDAWGAASTDAQKLAAAKALVAADEALTAASVSDGSLLSGTASTNYTAAKTLLTQTGANDPTTIVKKAAALEAATTAKKMLTDGVVILDTDTSDKDKIEAKLKTDLQAAITGATIVVTLKAATNLPYSLEEKTVAIESVAATVSGTTETLDDDFDAKITSKWSEAQINAKIKTELIGLTVDSEEDADSVKDAAETALSATEYAGLDVEVTVTRDDGNWDVGSQITITVEGTYGDVDISISRARNIVSH